MSESRRARLPWVLLVLSVVLNLAFLGGFAWTRAHHARFASGAGSGYQQRLERAVEGLKLDAGQQQAWNDFVQNVRQRGRGMREANAQLLDSAWSELAKTNPDGAAVERAFEQAGENRRQFQRDTMQSMTRFLATLGPEQRVRFLERARRPEPPRSGERPPRPHGS